MDVALILLGVLIVVVIVVMITTQRTGAASQPTRQQDTGSLRYDDGDDYGGHDDFEEYVKRYGERMRPDYDPARERQHAGTGTEAEVGHSSSEPRTSK